MLSNFVISAAAITPAELQEQLRSEAAILIDADTGQVLFEKNMHRQMIPASITKIMTALLALEKGNLSDMITMSHDAVFTVGRDTSHIALNMEEQLTLEQALYALSIESANDAANGIAELVGGTMDNFAMMMNERAKEAGALNTNFTNAHGLCDENHYTTAYDMAMIMRAAIKAPRFSEIFTAPIYEMPPTNKQPEPRTFRRRQAMVDGYYKYDGVIAEKTGWTVEAQHTFVVAARRDGRTLIAVVMKSPVLEDKCVDAIPLFDYGFNEFINVSFSAEEISEDNVMINQSGEETEGEIIAAEGFNCLVPKSLTKNDVEIKYAALSTGTDSSIPAKAIFTLKASNAMGAYINLGELNVTAYLDSVSVPTNMNTNMTILDEPNESKREWPVALVWLIRILGSIIAAFVVLFIWRYINIQGNRRRRRNRRNRRFKNYPSTGQ